MKRGLIYCFLSVLFVGLSLRTAAEDNGEQKVRKALDEIFSELDKTRIPTGFLEEYAVDYIAMDKYDDNQQDTTLISVDVMTYLMKGIRSASVGEKPFGDVDGIISKYKNDKPVAERTETYILFNAYKYNYIPDSAVSEGKIQVVNDKVKDVYKNGSWVNPYSERKLIAFSPIEHTVPMGVDFTFKFLPEQAMTNMGISRIIFDAGDGSSPKNIYKTSFTAHYTSPGRKKLHMTVWLNGMTVGVNSYVDVIDPQEEINIPTKGDIGKVVYGDLNKEFAQQDSPRTPKYSAIVTIKYAPSHNNTLQKPLIVVEGFDATILFPTYEDDVKKIYGRSNLYSFLQDSGPYFNYFKENYDIVYVDWNTPEVSIDRNSSLLRMIIRWVNSQKVTDEKNIIIAQSMGGLIAQQALCIMEAGEKEHQTRMFVSYDVPYFGVNIPIGLQGFVHSFFEYATHFGLTTVNSLSSDWWYFGKSDILSYLYEVLYNNSLSAHEMMMQVMKSDGTIVDNRTALEQNFKKRGLPKGDVGSPIVNIGFSNGVGSSLYPVLDNGNLLYINGELEPKYWASLFLSLIYDFNGPVKTLTDNNRWIKHLLALPGKSRLSLNAYAKASTNVGSQKISAIEIVYRKKLLGLIKIKIPVFSSSCTLNISDDYDTYYGSGYFLSPTESLSDYLTSDGNFYDFGLAAKEKWGRYDFSASLVSGFMFVPTASALAVGGGSRSLNKSDFQNYAYYNGNSDDIPFDQYMCSSTSNSHIGFDDEIYGLMKNNLFVISGPQIPVTGDKYVVKGLDEKIEVSWSSSKSWMTFSHDGTVTIDKDKADGVVEITATWSEGHNSYSKSKKVIAGIPEFSLDLGRIGSGHGAWLEVKVNDPEFVELAGDDLKYLWRRKEGESGKIESLGLSSNNRQIYYDFDAKGDAWYYVTLFLGEYNSSTHTVKVPYYKTLTNPNTYSYSATLDSDGGVFLSSDDNQKLPELEQKLMRSESLLNGIKAFKEKDERMTIIPVELNMDGTSRTVLVKIVKSDVLKDAIN